jgi:hypothetical protein
MTVDYRLTKEALEDLKVFRDSVKEEILQKIDEAAEDHFYNSKYYSKFYDHQGDIWDKLNFKIDEKPIRAVFMETQKEFAIIFIGNHKEFEYDTNLYTLLSERSQ